MLVSEKHVINSVRNFKKCLTEKNPGKLRYADRPHESWFNNYISEQRKIVKNRDGSTKITEKNIT